MKLAIMQPYFLPYIGYWQLISAVDTFIVYDNIKYTKKGWVNRNRFLLNGRDALFSLSLQKASDTLDIVERRLSPEFNRRALLSQIAAAYHRAPYFTDTFALIETIVGNPEGNLFKYLHASILDVCRHLDLKTRILISSEVEIDHGLKKQDKVIALCHAVGAATYVNATGGRALYRKEDFQREGISLRFIESMPYDYQQFGAPFLPWLSIVDVLMFNSLDTVKTSLLESYKMDDYV